jgi:hypothetical protein
MNLVARQISATHFGCGLQLYSSERDPIGWDGSRDHYASQLYSKYVTEICLATKFIQIFYIRQKIWFTIKQSYWNCQFQINMLSIFLPYKSSLARGVGFHPHQVTEDDPLLPEKAHICDTVIQIANSNLRKYQQPYLVYCQQYPAQTLLDYQVRHIVYDNVIRARHWMSQRQRENMKCQLKSLRTLKQWQ